MAIEPSLRQQLIDARARLRDQIGKLRFRPHPPNESGIGLSDDGAIVVDNSALIAKLTAMVQEIDESLAAMGTAEN
jgi:hypothetical protein